MPNFVMTYRNPTGYTPTGESTAAWMAWFDGMGDQLVDQGRPVTDAEGLGNCSPDSTCLGGYSVIEAASLEDAVEIAGGCPHLTLGGGVEVGRLGAVPPRA